jgi:hypothetical protein
MKTKTHPRIEPNAAALQRGEVPRRAVLDDGTEVTILYRPGFDLYRTPGSPANFGGVAEKSLEVCNHFSLDLPKGRSLSLFVNTESGLIVGDVHPKKGNWGFEFLRQRFAAIPTPPKAPSPKRLAAAAARDVETVNT